MKTKFLWLSTLAVIISFAGGFLLANALNGNEISKLQAQIANIQKNSKPSQSKQNKLNLTDEEILAKIKESEKDPNNFALQKGLGIALYRYAGSEEDKNLLEKVTPILERAYKINNDDYTVIVSLGNLYYDLGQVNKNESYNLKAREFYKKALIKNEKDSYVRTDFALTFLLTESPNREFAIKEFETALGLNPKNEKALVFITQAFIEEGKINKAKEYLDKIKEINPDNKKIAEYESAISELK